MDQPRPHNPPVAVELGDPRLKGPTMFGPFVLERRIAVGGTAEVFLAHPKVGVAPAPRLVVKRLLPTVGEGSHFELLEREAELHRRVKHPNVVNVYGAGMVRGVTLWHPYPRKIIRFACNVPEALGGGSPDIRVLA